MRGHQHGHLRCNARYSSGAKVRGMKLNRPDHDTRHMHAARSAAFRETVLPIVTGLAGQGISCRGIARKLNRRGVKTTRGKG